jgi:hypothetical protein
LPAKNGKGLWSGKGPRKRTPKRVTLVGKIAIPYEFGVCHG